MSAPVEGSAVGGDRVGGAGRDGGPVGDDPGGIWHWVLRGFVTVVVAVAALGSLAVWLWLRPLRQGLAQAVWLWLGCTLLVGVVALVWWPSHREHPAHRHGWVVLVGLVSVSAVMAGFGVVVARDDRRPALRQLVVAAVAGQPVTFEHEQTWAYQPRYVGDLGDTDWSVCRTYRVGGDPAGVVEHAADVLRAAGVGVGTDRAVAGQGSGRYAELRVEGDDADRLVVCVDEVDPSRR